MNKQRAKELADALEEALAMFSNEHQVQIKVKGGTYESHSLTVKVEMSEIGVDGVARTPEASAFVSYASRYGLDANDLNRTFSYGGTNYIIRGLKTRAKKNNILVERDNGKMYVMPARVVSIALNLMDSAGRVA